MGMVLRAFGVVSVVGCVSTAFATDPAKAFLVDVASLQGVAATSVNLRDCDWPSSGGAVTWTSPAGGVPLVDAGTGQVVAHMTQGSYSLTSSPRGRLAGDFTITAGPADTAIRLRIPQYSFLTIPASVAKARAWVSIDISDTNSSGLVRLVADGAPGDGAFKANWISNETTHPFASLIYLMEAQTVPGQNAGTVNVNDAVPASGYLGLNLPADGLAWEAAFILTAGDSVNVRGGMLLETPVAYITCPGDVTANYLYDLSDLTQLLADFGRCGPTFDPRVDAIPDGCLDISDLLVHIGKFGDLCD